MLARDHVRALAHRITAERRKFQKMRSAFCVVFDLFFGGFGFLIKNHVMRSFNYVKKHQSIADRNLHVFKFVNSSIKSLL